MHLFYCNNINNDKAVLSPDESGHCIRVLRLIKGTRVQLIDGTGTAYNAEITLPDAKKCEVKILDATVHAARNYNIHIAIAPTKNMDRFEWFVEKAVEIGVDIITPLLCERSERKILKLDRLEKLIISSMKQALIHYLPKIHELTGFENFIKSYHGSTNNRFIAHCEESEKKNLKDVIIPETDTIILIGPEGDFSPQEIRIALNNGFLPVSLGQNRLRTETAGIVACHIANL